MSTPKPQTLPLYTVDAFTSRPFRGNPAAVCLLPYGGDLDKDVKQKIAAEMKLSETAFINIVNEGDTFQNGKLFALKWFTPTCEVPLCGHATLASSAILFFECQNKSDVIEFKTVSGILKAKKLSDTRIQMDLPAYDSITVKDKYERLVKAVVGGLEVQNVVLSASDKLLIHLADKVTKEEFRKLQPDGNELMSAAPDIRGVILTLNTSGKKEWADDDGNQYDFASRYFGPWVGVPEDPVTGSAHSVLAPYWSKVLQKKKLYAHQFSTRGGDLEIEVLSDRVLISGNAVIVVKGKISF